jgi:hypothetical protein
MLTTSPAVNSGISVANMYPEVVTFILVEAGVVRKLYGAQVRVDPKAGFV